MVKVAVVMMSLDEDARLAHDVSIDCSGVNVDSVVIGTPDIVVSIAEVCDVSVRVVDGV